MALREITKEKTYQDTAQDLLKRASKCCIGVSWFAGLGRRFALNEETLDVDELSALAVEAIQGHLMKLGAVGKRFERKLIQVKEKLQSTQHNAFQQGLVGLGEMLGFHAESPEGYAVPDCIWSIGDIVYVVHEVKSEHTPGDPIGVNDIRQAESYSDWVRANRTCEDNTEVLCLIESPRTTVDPEAIAYAGCLFHVTPIQLKEIFETVAVILRRVRSKLTNLSDEKVFKELFKELSDSNLTPTQLLDRLSKNPVKEM